VIVFDASAAVELLLGTPRAAAIRTRIARPRESLHAPHLFDIEVVSSLRRFVSRGLLAGDAARDMVEDLSSLRLARYPHAPLLDRIWQLRENFTAADAAYVALAEGLDAPLLTSDERLAGAAGASATVELIR
jgi:predicted nucleic acid-binding protein